MADPVPQDKGAPNAGAATHVITLWQPWASLIFAGYKRFETRSFRYPKFLAGQEIAIHAAAKFPALRHIGKELHEICYDAFGCSYNYSLPLGKVIGTVRLAGCYLTSLAAQCQSQDELVCGDWSAGRYAWALTDVEPFERPIVAKGKRGWWGLPTVLIDSHRGRDRVCGCHRCTMELVEREPWDTQARQEGGSVVGFIDPRVNRMFLCAICGNKRCPHAADHRLACTGSNAPGQPGSLYEDAPTPPQSDEDHA